MHKLLLIGLLCLTACLAPAGSQNVTPELSPAPAATSTRLAPTPIPATATATLTPPPSFTPEPPPRYFTEEFDGPLNSWSTLYASGDSSRIKTLDENGKLTFELYSPNAWLYIVYGAHQYDTVHIETSVENLGSDLNDMGLICNYDEQAGWLEFNLSSDGKYSLLYGQWLAEGVASYMPVADDVSEAIHTGQAGNEIGLDCLGDTVQLYINGKLFRKIDVSRFELGGGKVGLTVASFDELPVILAFERVTVREP